jgi:hypothetical protein
VHSDLGEEVARLETRPVRQRQTDAKIKAELPTKYEALLDGVLSEEGATEGWPTRKKNIAICRRVVERLT